MRELKFRFWNGKKMLKDASIWNGLLVCEGDTIPLQFTGLKDKNGKEIYEGDIVRFFVCWDRDKKESDRCSYIGEIVWDIWGLRFVCQSFRGMSMAHDLDNIEVIGNIYENTELLKGA